MIRDAVLIPDGLGNVVKGVPEAGLKKWSVEPATSHPGKRLHLVVRLIKGHAAIEIGHVAEVLHISMTVSPVAQRLPGTDAVDHNVFRGLHLFEYLVQGP